MSESRRRILLDVVALFAVAFALRLGFALWLPTNDSVFWDQPYKIYAQNFAEGRGFWMPNPYSESIGMERAYAFRPPLFPFLWGCVYRLTGGSYVPIRATFALLGALTVVLAYLAGREMTGDRSTALLAGLACALYPPLIWHSVHLMTEPMFIFFQTLCILALFRLRATGRIRWVIVAGIATGLGTLTRSVLVGFAPLLAVWIIWMGGWKKRAWANAVGFGVVILIVMSPWIIRNYRVFHRFVPTTTDAGHGFYVANNPDSLDDPRGFWIPEDWGFLLRPGETSLDEVEARRRLTTMTRDFLLQNPGTAVRLMARRFVTLWRFWPNPQFVNRRYVLIYAASYMPLIPFILTGLWLAHRQYWDRLPNLALVDGLVLYTTAIHVIFLAMMRYRVPLMPFLIVFAGVAGAHLIKGGRGTRGSLDASSQRAVSPANRSHHDGP